MSEYKKERYKAELSHGHILLWLWGTLVVIDTGAEDSIGEFATEEWSVSNSKNTLVSLKKIAECIGEPSLKGLLGMNILGKTNWSLNLETEEFAILEDEPKVEGIEVPIEFFMGLPVIEIEINGNKTKCFLDFGAKLSYLPPSTLIVIKPLRTESDFHPLVGGSWQTAVIAKEVLIGGEALKVESGVLPTDIQFLLGNLTNIPGILGIDLLKQYEVVCLFKSQRKRIVLRRLQEESEVAL